MAAPSGEVPYIRAPIPDDPRGTHPIQPGTRKGDLNPLRMRRFFISAWLVAALAPRANAQSAAAACAASTDASARQFMRDFGDLRVCMLAFGGDSTGGPLTWAVSANRVVLETQRENDRRRLMVSGDVVEWTINGQQRAVDSASQAWRVQVIGLLGPAWEAAALREDSARLRMDIDSLPVRHARYKAQLDTLEATVRQLNASLQSIRSGDRTLRSQIAATQSRLNSLNSQVLAEQPRTNSPDPAVRARAEQTIRRLEEEIRRQEDIMRSAERRQQELDAERKVDAIERQLSNLRPEHTTTMLKLQLNESDPSMIPALQQDFANLDAGNRLRALDVDVAAALARLKATLQRP